MMIAIFSFQASLLSYQDIDQDIIAGQEALERDAGENSAICSLNSFHLVLAMEEDQIFQALAIRSGKVLANGM